MSSGKPPPKTYASVVAPQTAKTAKTMFRIRIVGVKNLQAKELLSRAKQHIEEAFAIRLMRSNGNFLFAQSAFQRDAALNMRQPSEFKIPLQCKRRSFDKASSSTPYSSPHKCGHHGPSQSSVITAASGYTPRRRVERQLGPMSAQALTKLRTVQRIGFLVLIAARNTVRGKKQRVGLINSTWEVYRRLGWIYYREHRKYGTKNQPWRQCEQSERQMIRDLP